LVPLPTTALCSRRPRQDFGRTLADYRRGSSREGATEGCGSHGRAAPPRARCEPTAPLLIPGLQARRGAFRPGGDHGSSLTTRSAVAGDPSRSTGAVRATGGSDTFGRVARSGASPTMVGGLQRITADLPVPGPARALHSNPSGSANPDSLCVRAPNVLEGGGGFAGAKVAARGPARIFEQTSGGGGSRLSELEVPDEDPQSVRSRRLRSGPTRLLVPRRVTGTTRGRCSWSSAAHEAGPRRSAKDLGPSLPPPSALDVRGRTLAGRWPTADAGPHAKARQKGADHMAVRLLHARDASRPPRSSSLICKHAEAPSGQKGTIAPR
jgi:hypothetical protein